MPTYLTTEVPSLQLCRISSADTSLMSLNGLIWIIGSTKEKCKQKLQKKHKDACAIIQTLHIEELLHPNSRNKPRATLGSKL